MVIQKPDGTVAQRNDLMPFVVECGCCVAILPCNAFSSPTNLFDRLLALAFDQLELLRLDVRVTEELD